jgi:O-antigen/teichoic acid export membrane protein
MLATIGVAALLYWSAVSGAWPPTMRSSALAAAALLPALVAMRLGAKALQGFRRVSESMVWIDLIHPAGALGVIALMPTLTAVRAMVAYTGVAYAVACLQCARLHWRSRDITRRSRAEWLTAEWQRVATPMMFSALGTYMVARSAIVVLGALTDMDRVGIYSAASRLCMVGVMPVGVAVTIASPSLAASFHTGDRDEFRASVRRMSVFAACAGAAMCAVLNVWPRGLLLLFGHEFVGGAPLVRVLSFAALAAALGAPARAVLLMVGREKENAVSLVAAGVTATGVTALLVPQYGVIGAAWARLAVSVALNTYHVWLAARIEPSHVQEG